MPADRYVPTDEALRYSESLFVPVIRRWWAEGFAPRPMARVFSRFGDWFVVVSWPPRRHDPGATWLVLALTREPLIGGPAEA